MWKNTSHQAVNTAVIGSVHNVLLKKEKGREVKQTFLRLKKGKILVYRYSQQMSRRSIDQSVEGGGSED